MKDDLIRRSELLAEYDQQHEGEAGRARTLIAKAPAVDAVPVVRCKYCQHSSCAYEGAQRYCRRHYGERRAVDDMGFCSDGERS